MMRTVLLAIAFLGPLQAADDAVRDWVLATRSPGTARVAQEISDVGRPPTVLGTLVLIALFDRAGGIATAVRTLGALVPTNIAVEALKRLTFRARPDGQHKRSNAAFPSSHAANAAAVAWVFARRWRRLAPAFAAFALLVAASRVVLDRHWTTDVVVGVMIGAGFAWAVLRRWPIVLRPRAPAPPA